MADYVVNPWAGQDIGFGAGMTTPDLAAPSMLGASQDPSILGQWSGQDIGFGAGKTTPDSSGGWDWSKIATGLKELGGSTKGGGLPDAGRPAVTSQAGAANLHQGTAGSLSTLLQILAARAQDYYRAAQQGAVPAQRGGGGLLGL